MSTSTLDQRIGLRYAVVSFPSHLDFINVIINNREDVMDVTQIYIFTPSDTSAKAVLNLNEQMKRLCIQGPKKCKESKVYCSICCENVKTTEYTRTLPCLHCFHKKCVDKWFVSAMKESEDVTCPLCRKKIELNL